MALVKLMHHDARQTGGPLTADVPEAAVPIWLECGWRRVHEESAPVSAEESAAMPEEEGVPASSESAPEPVQKAPAQAPEPRKRGRKKAAAA